MREGRFDLFLSISVEKEKEEGLLYFCERKKKRYYFFLWERDAELIYLHLFL